MDTSHTRSIAELTGKYSPEHIAAYALYRANRYSVAGLSETTQKILAAEDSGIAQERDEWRAKEAEADRSRLVAAAEEEDCDACRSHAGGRCRLPSEDDSCSAGLR